MGYAGGPGADPVLYGLTRQRVFGLDGTGPHPHPATHRILTLGGRVGVWAGAISPKCKTRQRVGTGESPE